jgi:uncharacterized protein (DUF302 family)
MHMKKFIIFVVGFIMGAIFLGVAVIVVMPNMMIISSESRYDFNETVFRIEQSIQKAGWSHKGTSLMSEEISMREGKGLGVRVAGIKLCKAAYARDILQDERSRFASCLMPCTISVWESDEGKVYVSKMNTGLMGKLFGGKMAEIMADKVGPQEHEMLKDIIN